MQFLFQLGDLSSLEQHGFAGNRMWSLDRDPSPLPPLDNQSFVELILKSTKVDLKTPCRYIWIQTVFASFSFSLSTFLLIKDKALLNGTISHLFASFFYLIINLFTYINFFLLPFYIFTHLQTCTY